jgi:hypothetical protein
MDRMHPSMERSIAERATQQLGHITRAQLREIGVGYQGITHLRDIGRLIQVGGRTFRIGGVTPTWDGALLAACLDIGGVASHRSAARLHGLAGFSRCNVIELTVLHGARNSASASGVVHRTTSLPAEDVLTMGNTPSTSVARTLLGLAGLVDEIDDRRLADVIDTAIRDGLASDRWLWWHLDRRRRRGRPGVGRLEDILRFRARLGPTESWLEREFLDCIIAANLPVPLVQRRVGRAGAFVARVDFLYAPQQLVIEVKGHRHHSTREQLAADSRRENELLLTGCRVLQFTYDDLVRNRSYVMATVAEALRIQAAAPSISSRDFIPQSQPRDKKRHAVLSSRH